MHKLTHSVSFFQKLVNLKKATGQGLAKVTSFSAHPPCLDGQWQRGRAATVHLFLWGRGLATDIQKTLAKP